MEPPINPAPMIPTWRGDGRRVGGPALTTYGRSSSSLRNRAVVVTVGAADAERLASAVTHLWSVAPVPIDPVPTPSTVAVPSNPVLDGLPTYFTQTMSDALEREPMIDFSVGDPHEPTPAPIRRALIDAVTDTSSYPSAIGAPRLREAVAAWVRRRHGVEVDPDRHVLASAGSKEAIFHLPLAVIDAHGERRGVVWGDPGYPIYDRGTRFAGGRSRPSRLSADDAWLLDLADLPGDELSGTAIAWLNYPHNPTGAVADRDYLRSQLEIARQHGFLLASDECYQEIWFDTPPPSILEVCDGDLTGVIAIVSLSKRSGMTGYRSGAMIGDPELIARLKRLRVLTGSASPSFVQAAATVAWQDQSHVDDRRAIFAEKRAIVMGFLAQHDFEVSGSDATFYVWFRAPGGDDVAYGQALMATGLLATPGRSFGDGGRGWMRLALVPTAHECRLAMDRWATAIEQGRLPSS